MPEPLILVVLLEVRRESAAAFSQYEASAMAIMARHRGRIERVIELESQPQDASFRHVHVVRFEDAAAFDSYRQDPDMLSLAPLREVAILNTQLWRGRDLADFPGNAEAPLG